MNIFNMLKTWFQPGDRPQTSVWSFHSDLEAKRKMGRDMDCEIAAREGLIRYEAENSYMHEWGALAVFSDGSSIEWKVMGSELDEEGADERGEAAS